MLWPLCWTRRSFLPGTNVRFGLDALIGLVPGVGDAITTAMSLYLVHEARQLGAPSHVIIRMLANIAIDGFVGAVPLVGDGLRCDVALESPQHTAATGMAGDGSRELEAVAKAYSAIRDLPRLVHRVRLTLDITVAPAATALKIEFLREQTTHGLVVSKAYRRQK